MSALPISRSPDLARLRAEGYDIAIQAGHVVMRSVPYVTGQKQVAYGELVTALTLRVDGRAAPPGDHTVYFAGEEPCNAEGRPLDHVIVDRERRVLEDGFVVSYRFSHKPPGGYANFYDKLTSYANILTAYARRIDRLATAATFGPIETDEDASVFRFTDTATSRAGIGAAAGKLTRLKIAIIGLGGTGSYILDLVAKSSVSEIHLWDGDRYLWHNVFRAPGPPPTDDAADAPFKVEHYAEVYGHMRRGVYPHPVPVDDSNADELRGMDFVFIAVDDGPARKLIAAKLEEFGIPFIDVGIGVYQADGALGGLIRTTTSTPTTREHTRTRHPLPLGGDDHGNEYDRNIQVAELNALNAALAVVKWKKHFGFYADFGHEHFSVYAIDANALINEACADPCPDRR